MYNPKKYIDYESLEQSKEENRILAEIKKEQKALLKEHRPREKTDYKRFNATENKKLVFYSEKSGFYKYFENVIEELLKRTDIIIHYITSDPNDAIFNKKEEKIIPYYIGETKLIPLFMKMDADMVVMTMPDLDNFHIKRSIVRKDIEYVFIAHWLTSISMVVREKSLNNYDTVFCVGPHWVKELRRTEEMYGSGKKNLIETGYGVLEKLAENYNKLEKKDNQKPQILIGPSWQQDNIMDSCIDNILDSLLKENYKIIVRPHPEYIKRYPGKVKLFNEKYNTQFNDDFIFQTDFSSNNTVFESDMVITDWSNLAFEYSLTTKNPSIFVNTEMKVMNPNYMKIGIEPVDILLRNKVGKTIEKAEAANINYLVTELLENKNNYEKVIANCLEDYIFNFGKSGLIESLYIKQKLTRN